jgi:polyphosphate kinase
MPFEPNSSLQGAIMTGPGVGTGSKTGEASLQSVDRIPGSAEALYFNRELSWLTFNQRVLAEAQNEEYPLLERLRFLSISGSNLDEFMTVRVAGLAGQARRQIEEMSIDGRTPSQQLVAIREAYTALEQSQQQVWRDLRALLADNGISLARVNPDGDADAAWLRAYFLEHID